MRSKDYFRLAKISLASRKSTTKSTVRGIAFGLILLIPVIFITLALFGDLNKKINQNPELLYANMIVASERTGINDSMQNYQPTIGSKRIDSLIEDINAMDKIYYEQIYSQFHFDRMRPTSQGETAVFEVMVENQPTMPLSLKNDNSFFNNNPSPFAAVVNLDKTGSDSFVPKKIASKFDNDIFLNNMFSGFTDDGLGQVILSEVFVEILGINPQDVYNKKITISFKDTKTYNGIRVLENDVYFDNDKNPDNNDYDQILNSNNQSFSKDINFCYEFEVVGIIKKEVTAYAQKVFVLNEGDISRNIMSNMMFFTNASKVLPNGQSLEPVITEYTKDAEEGNYTQSIYLATYSMNDNEFENLNKKYLGFGVYNFNSFSSEKYNYNAIYPKDTLFIDAANYAELDKIVSSIANHYNHLFTENARAYIMNLYISQVYSDLYMVFTLFTYIIIFLTIIGGIIFFSAMVNLFNSVVHSIDLRRNYLGVLRAVGAKNRTIPRLYLAEALTLFKRASIWIMIFSGLICTGIKFGLDSVFSYINQTGILPYKLSINIMYIPLSFAIGITALILLGVAFSFGCSKKVSRDPIMSILGDN